MAPPKPTTSSLGLAHSRRGAFPFGMHLADRLMHIHIIGQTGTGKSTTLANLATQDAAAGHGVCIIDPHGDLADSLANVMPDSTQIWNVADPHCAFGYNPLTRVPAAYQPLVASGLIDALKKQWADAWGARMEHLLRHAVLALLAQPKADLRDVVRLFIDKELRARVIHNLSDDQVRQFWVQEFPEMNYKTAFDGVAPIANKLGAFLSHPVVRRALCEPAKPLRFRQIMDARQCLIINLAKGRLGSDMANVLGGLIVASILNAAFSRQTVPPEERHPFFLHIDEFHNYTTKSIAEMLPETRKYGLGLTLVHQHRAQVESDVFDAILGNAGSLVVFRVGAQDAPLFQRHLEAVTLGDLINLPNRRAYARVMVDGERTRTFSMETLPPKNRPQVSGAE